MVTRVLLNPTLMPKTTVARTTLPQPSPSPPASVAVPEVATVVPPPIAIESNQTELVPEIHNGGVVRGFDNSVIQDLNRRLEDPDWQKRAEASNDFSMLLGANPQLERRALYKPYIDAFMLKILRDTSAVVHEPALRAIEVGYYRYPTAAVMDELVVLARGDGLFGLEPQMVTDALAALSAYQQQEQKQKQAKATTKAVQQGAKPPQQGRQQQQWLG